MNSPLPWRVEDHLGTISIKSADDATICCDEQYYPTAPSEDDMKLIVQSVNKAAQLESMLINARNILKDGGYLYANEIDKVLES